MIAFETITKPTFTFANKETRSKNDFADISVEPTIEQ